MMQWSSNRLTAFIQRFSRDEAGSVTVEAVLWIPFFFGLLMLITDVSLAFFSRAEAFRLIEIGNRSFSVRPGATTADVETWIEEQFDILSPGAQATTRVDAGTGIVSTILEYPAREVSLFGSLGVMGGWTIRVRAMQYVERAL